MGLCKKNIRKIKTMRYVVGWFKIVNGDESKRW